MSKLTWLSQAIELEICSASATQYLITMVLDAQGLGSVD